ncbi:MAG: DeoR/GlpR family DNA-binding transcription regulator [Kineosporiaceae bacterium]
MTSDDPDPVAGVSLSRYERQERIVDVAMAEERVDVGELATRFRVTTETIRRDLATLQERRLLRRVHGGAVPWQRWRYEPSLTVRGSQHPDEKYRIAERALDEVADEESIIIDSGSTAAQLAGLLPRDRRLTVVTNSVPVVQVLATNEAVDVILLGGALKKATLALVDPTGVAELSTMSVDLAVLGSDGVSSTRGFTTPHRDEVEIKRAMLAAARRAIVLVDHSKFGSDYLHRIATVDEVDAVVTDSLAPEDEVAALRALGPMVIRA